MAINVSADNLLFSKADYEYQLGYLDTRITNLEDILSQYKEKKNQISYFWDGQEAEDARKGIETQIKACENALKDAKETRKNINSIMEAYARTESQNKENLANIVDLFTDLI